MKGSPNNIILLIQKFEKELAEIKSPYDIAYDNATSEEEKKEIWINGNTAVFQLQSKHFHELKEVYKQTFLCSEDDEDYKDVFDYYNAMIEVFENTELTLEEKGTQATVLHEAFIAKVNELIKGDLNVLPDYIKPIAQDMGFGEVRKLH